MKYSKTDLEIGDRFRYKDPKSIYPEHTIISVTDTHLETKKSDGALDRYKISDILNHINRNDIRFIKNVKNYEIY